MTDPNRSPEYQAFKDRIAEHVEAIHTASRELLGSRRTGNDAGSGKLLVAMETVMEPPAVEPSDQDHDGRLRIENVCPDRDRAHFRDIRLWGPRSVRLPRHLLHVRPSTGRHHRALRHRTPDETRSMLAATRCACTSSAVPGRNPLVTRRRTL